MGGGTNQESAFSWGGLSLFHRFLPLSFFVPCALEVTSGMFSWLFASPFAKCPHDCGVSVLPAPGF